VRIVADDQEYETTAGDIGLALDEDATADEALRFGRRDPLVIRPFTWLGSFFGSRQAPLHYSVSEATVSETLTELQAGDVTEPTEPKIELRDEGFTVVPGQPGEGLNARMVAEDLLTAAEDEDTAPTDEIEIVATDQEVEPRVSDAEAQQVADEANALTADGLTLVVNDTEVRAEPQQLRRWLAPLAVDERLTMDTVNAELVTQEVAALFEGLTREPQNATVELRGGKPAVVPGRDGVRCCGEDSVERIWKAFDAGEPSVTLEAQVTQPEVTTEEAEGWGIKEPIGGSRAWRDGGPIPGPRPGFTTFYVPGQTRVTNIHRIADLVNGAVVPPGGSFSINGHVGARTVEKGFVPAGAIKEGQHVDEVGGGVSQFATTFFNAAYFSGVDITNARAHTEYFSRYPRGREATMGSPGTGLDVEFVNDTPRGILIQTSHTADSVTVTFWSTPYATAEQTGISESKQGLCDVVTTTRTINYPDRATRTETWTATYRPGENVNCNGKPINPEPEGEGQ
jgi:vancomycin resistance protein YoaR